MNYGEYWQIPWDLGIMRNYTGTTTPVPTNPPACAYTPGDANGSGSVDIVDALIIAQQYVGLAPSG